MDTVHIGNIAHLYLMSGRISGDDDDSVEIVHARDVGHASVIFENHLRVSDPSSLDKDELPVFITMSQPLSQSILDAISDESVIPEQDLLSAAQYGHIVRIARSSRNSVFVAVARQLLGAQIIGADVRISIEEGRPQGTFTRQEWFELGMSHWEQLLGPQAFINATEEAETPVAMTYAG